MIPKAILDPFSFSIHLGSTKIIGLSPIVDAYSSVLIFSVCKPPMGHGSEQLPEDAAT